MPDQTTIERALADACAFAKAHGVDSTITPADFGIRPAFAQSVHATYIDGDHAVSAIIEHHGHTSFAVAELFWVHDQGDEERDPCDPCGECERCAANPCECGPPMVNVYLPGDAPQEVASRA